MYTEKIIELGIAGINQIWRDAKLRAVGIKRATTLYETAQHSIGLKNGRNAAEYEMKLLLQDYDYKQAQYESVMEELEHLCRQIPESEQMLAIKGIGLITVAGFLAEVGDLRRFESPRQIQKLAGLSLKENSSGKHKGQTTISKRGRSRLRAILFNAVIPLIATNAEFRELHRYYTTRTVNPLKKKQSVIAISCKLIRLFYAILTKGAIYDGEKMLSDIHRNLRWSSIFVTFTLKKIIDWNISFQTVSCIHLMNVDVYDCNSHIHNPACFHLTLDLFQTDSVA